jgi:hypothetical protein
VRTTGTTFDERPIDAKGIVERGRIPMLRRQPILRQDDANTGREREPGCRDGISPGISVAMLGLASGRSSP